jgi:hypothetical protein
VIRNAGSWSRDLKQRYAIFAGLMAIGLACAEPAAAQFIPYPSAGDMPPHEVIALVNSAGLKPVGRPVRRGPAYVLQAVNQSGREVRVIVDVRLRRIARVVAVAPARAAEADVPPPPAPYGRPPGDIAGVPESRSPSARVGGLPPDADPAEPYGPTGQQSYGQVAAVGSTPVVPNRPPVTEPAMREAGPPPLPLPRPRPKFAAAEPDTVVPGATAAAEATPPVPAKNNVGAAAAAADLAAKLSKYEPVYEEQE